ncbi:alpha/beta fold hydrolase [Acuticoccus mangrovi]|uniref:Alpha/beta fold hydrolase n=1 Tax=Acuticoccus mangrovi TaxID=2796142 RepID=A0A934IR06_9HYPH|nr:alpha/beta fold hydrolase [Acuticoccus mangrovi]MBJ3777080.1 alpha/beta fold hydrolase [Acuticoccus mangrovi]
MSPAEIGYADVNGVALRYAVRRTGRPRLVLVHEMGGSLESWDEAADSLAAHWEILSYDARGAGLSEKIIGTVTIDDLAADLLALLDRIGWTGPVRAAGTAVGAATAIRAAVRTPDRFRALAALSPALGVPPDRRAATYATAETIERTGVRAATDHRWDRAWPPHLRDDPARAEAARCRKLGHDPKSFAALYRMVAEMNLAPDLARLSCPTLVLAGRFDATRPPEQVAAVAAAIPGATYEVVDSGHVMQAISPSIIADRLDRFFAATD